MHLVRLLLDEVFGSANHCATITVTKTSQVTATLLPEVTDFLLWYARDKAQVAYNQLYELRLADEAGGAYQWVEIRGKRRKMTPEELANPAGVVANGGRIYTPSDATSQGYGPWGTMEPKSHAKGHSGPRRRRPCARGPRPIPSGSRALEVQMMPLAGQAAARLASSSAPETNSPTGTWVRGSRKTRRRCVQPSPARPALTVVWPA